MAHDPRVSRSMDSLGALAPWTSESGFVFALPTLALQLDDDTWAAGADPWTEAAEPWAGVADAWAGGADPRATGSDKDARRRGLALALAAPAATQAGLRRTDNQRQMIRGAVMDLPRPRASSDESRYTDPDWVESSPSLAVYNLLQVSVSS